MSYPAGSPIQPARVAAPSAPFPARTCRHGPSGGDLSPASLESAAFPSRIAPRTFEIEAREGNLAPQGFNIEACGRNLASQSLEPDGSREGTLPRGAAKSELRQGTFPCKASKSKPSGFETEALGCNGAARSTRNGAYLRKRPPGARNRPQPPAEGGGITRAGSPIKRPIRRGTRCATGAGRGSARRVPRRSAQYRGRAPGPRPVTAW